MSLKIVKVNRVGYLACEFSLNLDHRVIKIHRLPPRSRGVPRTQLFCKLCVPAIEVGCSEDGAYELAATLAGEPTQNLDEVLGSGAEQLELIRKNVGQGRALYEPTKIHRPTAQCPHAIGPSRKYALTSGEPMR